jgi:hypothetical protein
MKIRTGFVSNSSSSSFILSTRQLTSDQIEFIKDYEKIIDIMIERKDPNLKNFDLSYHRCKWEIEHDEDNRLLKFSTWMDNFNMFQWFAYLNIPTDALVVEAGEPPVESWNNMDDYRN